MPIVRRVIRKLRTLAIYGRYRRYCDALVPGHPLHGIKTRLVGDARADPTEFFDHYAAFAFWAASRLSSRIGQCRVLDLGSPKMFTGMLSVRHEVTSMVLADCGDAISNVCYIRHDVSDPLPFADASFDAFTSTVSLPLIGLARYGDRLNADCLPALIRELARVLRADGELIISMCLGRNVLNFNNGWFLDLPTIERLFSGFELLDFLVDEKSLTGGKIMEMPMRFTRESAVTQTPVGAYRVVFLRFGRREGHDSAAMRAGVSIA